MKINFYIIISLLLYNITDSFIINHYHFKLKNNNLKLKKNFNDFLIEKNNTNTIKKYNDNNFLLFNNYDNYDNLFLNLFKKNNDDFKNKSKIYKIKFNNDDLYNFDNTYLFNMLIYYTILVISLYTSIFLYISFI